MLEMANWVLKGVVRRENGTLFWHKPVRKRKNLVRLGVSHNQAYAWSRTMMGGWATAQPPIMRTTITLSRLRKRGYESMLSYYRKTIPGIQ